MSSEARNFQASFGTARFRVFHSDIPHEAITRFTKDGGGPNASIQRQISRLAVNRFRGLR